MKYTPSQMIGKIAKSGKQVYQSGQPAQHCRRGSQQEESLERRLRVTAAGGFGDDAAARGRRRW